MLLTLKAFTGSPRHGALLLAAACFAAGLTAGALLTPNSVRTEVPTKVTAQLAPEASALRGGQPAEVLQVIDGDTFEARVRIWPGMDVTTKVRLRGIDAPELHARCEGERAKALVARDALARILREGSVGVARVGQDKYGGRVDADVSTMQTLDVAEVMLAGGFARRYEGGRRRSWCG